MTILTVQYVFQPRGLFDFRYLKQRKNLRKETEKAELLDSTSDMFHKPAKYSLETRKHVNFQHYQQSRDYMLLMESVLQ